jgi:hypothetical protein
MGYRIKMAAGTECDWLDVWFAEAIRLSRIRYERDQGSA